MPISAARSSASSTWWTAPWCWSTPPRGPCRRPSSWCRRRSRWGSSRSSSSTRSIGPTRRPVEVVNEVFDLFAALDASEEQLDFPVFYGSAKEGWMAAGIDGPKTSMAPLLDHVLFHVPPPPVDDGGPFRMLGTILESNPYPGRIITGRITSGAVRANQTIKVLDRDGEVIEQGRVSKVLAFRGLERQGVDEGRAGDIVSIAGLPQANVAYTLCAPEVTEPLPAQPIDPP